MSRTRPNVARSSAGSAPAKPGSKRWLLIAGALLFVFHACAVLHSLPLQAVFTNQPLRGTSYDRHYGQVLRVVSAMETVGRSWAYDVQLFAGQPEGAVGDLDSKAWELWTSALCRLGVRPTIAFNTFVLVAMLLGPAIVGVATICFGLTPATGLLATALTALLWFFDSYLHWLWFSGMISWLAASAVAVVALGLFQRWLGRPRARTAVFCGVTMGVAVLLHAAAILTVLPPLCIVYATQVKQLGRRDRWAPIAMLVIAAAVNLYWLPALFEHRQFIAAGASNPLSGVRTLLCDLVNLRCPNASSGGLGVRSGLRLACWLLAAAWALSRRGERKAGGPVLRWGIACTYALAFLGALVPGLASADPYQQLAPALLMTTMPAAEFLSALALTQGLREMGAHTRWLLAVLSLVMARELLAGELLYFLPNLTPEPKFYPDGAKSPLSQFGYIWAADLPSALYFGVPHDDGAVEEVADWTRRFVPPGARVLVENAVLGERLAWRDGYEVIGGESRRWLQHVDASYFSRLRDRRGAAPELSHYLNMYAIDYVVGGLAVFREAPFLTHLVTVSRQHIYHSELHSDRILRGGGTVRARTNTIEVSDSRPDEELVLSYHWHPALRCKPGCRATRVSVEGDRVGFIGIPSPHPRDLVLWNSYESE